jgi:hypothetical protein
VSIPVRKFLLVIGLAIMLAGCSSAVPAPTGTASPARPVAEVPAPVALTVPALDLVDVPLMGLGLNPDKTMATPPVDEPERVGWFEPGVKPGEQGPAVIAAHVSGRLPGAEHSIPGAFAHLSQLKPGDQIDVRRQDGTTVDFAVTRRELHDKDAFPTAAVYGDVPDAQLRLITCGGTWNPAEHSYEDNWVVFAELVR